LSRTDSQVGPKNNEKNKGDQIPINQMLNDEITKKSRIKKKLRE
jgi:hypothetical protein